jgi:prepilin-type processing-associated H-X9-DG protein
MPIVLRRPVRVGAAEALFNYPGHCSYIYLGKGLNDRTVAADTVVLYEPLTNHQGDGMHVLFGDFHVEWVPASIAQTILTQHAASTQPIRLKTGASSS